MSNDKNLLANRFEAANVSASRFIEVLNGKKRSPVNHRQVRNRVDDPRQIDGNYGVYAGPDPDEERWVIDVDIDDYSEDVNENGLRAMQDLPETFRVESPHTDGNRGGHRYYIVESTEVADKIETLTGSKNPTPSWGELRVHNQYVVGPGSYLSSCDKEWCDSCTTDDGGQYTVANDVPLATISSSELIDALVADGYRYGQEDATTSSETDEEWLTDDIVEDALSNIDPDEDHDEWISVIAAINDYDDSASGKRIAEDWSKSGTKWDSAAQRSIDSVWTHGANNSTVGTIIHKAQKGGWEPPANNGNSGPSPEEIASEHGVHSWPYVRTLYENDEGRIARQRAADILEDSASWMYVLESEILWVYDSTTGYYNPWGEAWAGDRLETELGQYYSQNQKREIIGRLEDRNQTHREELNARDKSGYYLCVGNGVLELSEREFMDHSPKYKFTRGLSWDWQPESADPEPVLEFLDDVTHRGEDRDTILDHLAHGLMPGHPYRAFIIKYGPGSNGKTRLGKLLREFVGEDNAAAVELQDLTGDDDFATGALPGSFINVGDDVSISELREVSQLKSATGGGTMRANEKYEKKYDFQNEAAMFFSANEPPRIAEESDAIGDRLYPIEMPYRFVDESEYDPEDEFLKLKDPRVVDRLVQNPQAMRGLLLLAADHAEELIESNGQYSMPEDPSERRAKYEAASDPIHRFAYEYLEPGDSSDEILKEDAYTVYKALCDREDERIASQDGFKRQISQQSIVGVENRRSRKLTPGDGRVRCWKYVKFSEAVKDLMPPRLEERYFGEGESASMETDEEIAYNATPIAKAAETMTGYVSVTVEIASVREIGENGGVTAVLKDSSGAIDMVAWDEPYTSEIKSHESDYVAIQHAESGEYEGKRQLKVKEAVTEIKEIQPGVGYSSAMDPGDGQSDLGAATDGGLSEQEFDADEAVPEDAEGTLANARRLAKILRQESEPLEKPALFGKSNVDPEKAERGLERGLMDGMIIKTGDGYTSG